MQENIKDIFVEQEYSKGISMAEQDKNIDIQDVNNYNSLYFNPQLQPKVNNKNNEKLESFKKRLDLFKNIKTLEEAKKLLDNTMPVQLVRTTFFIGKAKCTIIKKTNLVKICFESPTEIIMYNFT